MNRSVERNRPTVRIVNSFFLLAYPRFFYEKIISFRQRIKL